MSSCCSSAGARSSTTAPRARTPQTWSSTLREFRASPSSRRASILLPGCWRCPQSLPKSGLAEILLKFTLRAISTGAFACCPRSICNHQCLCLCEVHFTVLPGVPIVCHTSLILSCLPLADPAGPGAVSCAARSLGSLYDSSLVSICLMQAPYWFAAPEATVCSASSNQYISICNRLPRILLDYLDEYVHKASP